MLRLRVVAAGLVLVVTACGDTRPPLELRTIAAESVPVAVVTPPVRALVDPATTTTTVPPAPPTTSAPPSTTTTAPRAPRTHTASVVGDGCLGWRATIGRYFPAGQIMKACAVMRCETGGTGSATIRNRSSSASGLFQFLDSTWRSTTGLDPPASAYPGDRQVAAAAALWRSSGWSPWSCA